MNVEYRTLNIEYRSEQPTKSFDNNLGAIYYSFRMLNIEVEQPVKSFDNN